MRGTASTPTKIGHGARTYAAGTDIGIDEKLGFSYSVSCSRNPVLTLGSGLPVRVTKEDVQIGMQVQGEDLGKVLTNTGYEATLDIYIHDVYAAAGATAIGRFGCTGQAFSQNVSVGNNGTMAGEISIAQKYLTGRRVV
jgi:hypothetical protein